MAGSSNNVGAAAVTAGGGERDSVGAAAGPAALTDTSAAMIWQTGVGGEGEGFNTGWLGFTGRPLGDLLGDGWLDAVHPDDLPAVFAAYAGVGDGGGFELECRLRRADGVYRRVLCRAAARFCRGEVAGSTTVGFDVTDRCRLETRRTDLLVDASEDNARLASLLDLTGRLAGLDSSAEVAAVVLGQAVVELDAATASLCLLGDDGESLQVAAHVGYPQQVIDRWCRFGLDAPTPAGDAVRDRVGVYVSTLVELHRRYPIFDRTPLVGDEALAVVPLAAGDTAAIGVLVIGFAQPRDFARAERKMLEVLAAQAAVALARTASREALEATRAQLRFLADAGAALAASLDVDDTVAAVAALAVPRLADSCAVFLVEQGGVEARRWAPAQPGVAQADGPRDAVRAPAEVDAVIGTGRSAFIAPVAERAGGAADRGGHGPPGHQVGLGGGLIVALRARRRVIGALVLANQAGHPMAADDLALAEELAARAACAIDNAASFQAQATVAQRLQANLLPAALPAIAGLEVAARYAAAADGVEVGGDFYDCVATTGDRRLLVIGDVKGKGVDAAAVAGMARHTIRAAARDDRGPGEVLCRLNDILNCHEQERASADQTWEAAEPRFCTVAAVALEPAEEGFKATVACAGHPLPLLRRGDGTVSPVGVAGDVLGVNTVVEVPEVSVALGPGDLLVCFTDGVSECHHGNRFFGEDGMADFLRGADGPVASVVADVEAAARTFTAAGTIGDDMAILAVKVPLHAACPHPAGVADPTALPRHGPLLVTSQSHRHP